MQRVIATIAGLVTVSGWLHGTFHDPDPRGQQLWVIVFRVCWCALILSIFLRRAVGKRMDAIGWAALALLVIPGIWDAKTTTGAIVFAISGALILAAARIEVLLGRAAEPRVAADGAARRRGTL
jgi:hypothetical protein